MAAKLDNSERDRRINLIGEHSEKTGDSTRQISDYFSKTQFPISNKTVHEYICKYKSKNNDKQKKIDNLINRHKGQSLEDEGVIERVFMVSRLVLEGHTIREISEILDISGKTVERDIFLRLKQICAIDEDLQIYYKIVLKCMYQHRIDALERGRCKNSINL